MSRCPEVRLADVDDPMMERLLELAQLDAAADDVTPPLGNGTGWNPERVDWFRTYHRSAAAGLEGPAAEKSWAVLCDGSPAGAIRLKLTDEETAQHETAETGIWLGRSYRGRGVGGAALELVLAEARRVGLHQVVAHTAAGNIGAQRLLTAAGAVLTHNDGGAVSAVVVLSADSQ
ncbi:ribosomal-protein-alanine N-acetyltransferase [Arthrobacter sp. UYNi723]